MTTKIKYSASLITGLLLLSLQPVQAAGEPQQSLLNNSLAVFMLILMAVLLIIIGVLGYVLLGTADFKLSKERKEKSNTTSGIIGSIVLMLVSSSVMAQQSNATSAATQTYGGMSSTTFYIMTAVIFLELFVILALLINVRILLKIEKERVINPALVKEPAISWWSRFNKFKPMEQEANLDLGHDYDGIRELDNRLPPWWLYGFYLSILFAGIYLWRFHVSHSGPSSKEEFENSVARAEISIKEYLKEKGESVDENTVTLLSSPADISEGRKIYLASCATCHKPTGAGDVGPNLTDDYWLHGNDLKSIFKTIRYGINAMPPWQNSYSNKQIAQVASFIKTLHGTKPQNPKAPQGELYKEEGNKPGTGTDSTSQTKTN